MRLIPAARQSSKGANPADRKDSVSPPPPLERTRMRKEKGKQSSLPRGGHWEGPHALTEQPCTTKDKGGHPSLSRGGHWGGAHPMTDKGAVSAKTLKYSNSAQKEKDAALSLSHARWASGRTCRLARFLAQVLFRRIAPKNRWGLRFAQAHFGDTAMIFLLSRF